MLARLLLPVSVIYRLLIAFRYLLYRAKVLHSRHLDVPVIVVGNVVAGGAGKTPLVMALVHHFQNLGLRVGVLSRGYGRSGSQCVEVSRHCRAVDCGDEAILIKRSTDAPLFIANKRFDAGAALLTAYPAMQLLICDDGLQHHALARDVEVVVFDDRGVGNGWLLPAGPLREPWPGRPQAGLNLVMHTGLRPAFQGYRASRRLARKAVGSDGVEVPLESLQRRRVSAVAAIANPEAFFNMLTLSGLTLERTIALPDHHDFNGFDVHAIGCDILLCTEKDAVKLFELQPSDGVQILAVPLDFQPEPAFLLALDALVLPLISTLPSGHGP